jgi:hypothetical protein
VRFAFSSLLGVLILAAGLSFASAKAADETAYLAGIEDVPLMDGLSEDTEAGVVFDKPSGRIVEAVAAGSPSPEAVGQFYRATLPELGWKTAPRLDANRLVFRRDDESLTLTLSRRDKLTVVRFSLAPRDATP